MSVFQLQEWWSVKVADDEEFDVSCFGVGNVDNATNRSNKIVIGSLKGILRIYYPSRPNFRIEDLVLEENLGKPILQILLGRFIPATESIGIAVLHPRELVVYEVIPQVVKDDRVSYYTLRRAYKHDLGIEGKHFTAFNMICGPFGGVRGRDMILVQSIDGKLQIFEQSAHSFSRQLLDCLIPGPLKYIPKRDAFVTVNYAGIAECYLYQTLAASQSDIGAKSESKSDAMGSFGLKGIRSANVEWSLNLGEQCRDILLGNFSVDIDSIGSGSAPSHANELLMVCEKSVFLVKAETGGVIQQRRLDRSEAACACTVPHIPNDSSQSQNSPNYNFLVAGQDGTIQVFSGFHLVWAARLTFTPIHMEVATFGGTKGLIVAVDDSGMLTVNFLGTKPPVTTVLTQVRDLDYDKIDEEHRMLLQIIRESQNESKGEVLDKLLIKSQIPKTFDMEPTTLPDLPVNSFVPIHPPNTTLHHDGQFVKICVRFFFSHNGERPVHNVSVSLSSPQHIYITPRQFVIPKVANLKSTPVVQKVTFYALKTYLPTSMEITATASYQSSNKGEPQIVAHHISLPLCMALRPKAPSKNAAYKVIVDTEYPAIPLTELFGDVLYAYQQAGYLDNIQESIGSNAVQAMGFQFFCNPTNSLSGSSGVNGSNLVSILVSKNAGRYRLQADSYELLALMMQELGQRLQNRINAQNQTSLPLSSIVKYNDVLPIDEYFAVIHTHLICRLRLQNFNAQLNDAAHQYRLIEKRLLVRFKDRNPTPLHGLDIILKESYDRIIRLADDIQSQQQKLKAMSNEIDCFSRLMSNLICMKYGLSIVDYAALQSYLCPEINDGVEQGWEETVHASLTHLLKTTLGKNTKESANLNSSTLEMPKNIDALKKSFLLMIDRIEKGGKIVVASTTTANAAAPATAGTSNGGSASVKAGRS